MHVLLLEPDKVLAAIYAQALSKAGHSVVCESDAQAAINNIDKYTPDVVILELQLASHNGLEFLYELRSYPEWQNMPAVVLSTVPDTSFSVGMQQQLGVVAYHYKPQTTINSLLNTLDGTVMLMRA